MKNFNLHNCQRGIVMVPYAYLEDFNTGVNIGKRQKQIEIYLKNCSVACISARTYCDKDTDIALVTNIEIPKSYKKLLERNQVLIIRFPFDEFCFDKKYAWSLAFYKLCVLSKASRELNYDYYAYIDSDVYIQQSFNNIWKECDSNILLYDINHSLENKRYQNLLKEINEFDGLLLPYKNGITHYGGEFYSANKINTRLFINMCHTVYDKMLESGCLTKHGDEFITTIAAHNLKCIVKNAGAYVFRYWTGTYRLVCTNYYYDPVVVLHCPAEKEDGFISIYNKYIRRGKVPSLSQAHRMLHLSHCSIKTIVKSIVKKVLKRDS